MKTFDEESYEIFISRSRLSIFYVGLPANALFAFVDWLHVPHRELPNFLTLRVFLVFFCLTYYFVIHREFEKRLRFLVHITFVFGTVIGLVIGYMAWILGGEESFYFGVGTSIIYLTTGILLVWTKPWHTTVMVVLVFSGFAIWIPFKEAPINWVAMTPHVGLMLTFAATAYMLCAWWNLIRLKEYSNRMALASEIESREQVIKDKVADLANSQALVRAKELQLEMTSKLADLASSVAHDIRSPLTALRMALTPSTIAGLEAQRLASLAMNRINDIANNLLTLHKSQIENSTHLPYLLAQKIDELMSEIRCYSPEAEVKFEIQPAHISMYSDINASQLMRCLANLINNAIEASSSKIEILLQEKASGLQVSVLDNGTGIIPEVLGKIGTKGFTSGKTTGNGLGFYNSRVFIEKVGGSLLIFSKPGVGTEVQILIPKLAPPEWSISELKIKGTKVVVVDDDVSIHALWREKFVRSNMNIIVESFYTLESFGKWLPLRNSEMILIDYEFSDETETGLSFIVKHGIDGAILVTSKYSDESLLNAVRKTEIMMIPKVVLDYIPVRIS